MSDGFTVASSRELVGTPFLRAMRHFWASDRYLWPASRFLLAARKGNVAKGVFTTVDGLVMRLTLKEYPDGSMYFGVYEVATIRLLRQLVRPGNTVVDVGGNIGYLTLRLGRLVGEQGKIITFEPVEASADRLMENVRLNQLENRIDLHRAAVGAEPGHVTMYTFGDEKDDRHVLASMSPLYDQHREVRVAVEVLDDVIKRPVQLMKVDVEGAEVGVIRGARRIIGEHRPHLILENNPGALRAFGHTFDDVLAAIRDSTDVYEIASIDGLRRKTWSITTAATQLPQGNLWIRPKA